MPARTLSSPAPAGDPVITARGAGHAVTSKLPPQPTEPDPEPMRRWAEEHPEYFSTDSPEDLEMRAADIRARNEGHAFGSPEYISSIENKLGLQEKRQEEEDKPRPMPRRGRGPSMMAPVSRSSPSWSSGRTTPTRTELTGEEIALAHSLGVDPETYRENKKKMNQMKASGVIQE